MNSALARTVFVALLAGVLFGAFLLLAPDPTASGEVQPATTTSTVVAAPTTTALATTTTVPPNTSSTTIPPTTTTTTVIPEWNPAEQTPSAGYDGSVTIGIVTVDPLAPREGDTVTWRLRITNATDGRLWGVFAWVEGFGQARCPSTRIEPGQGMTCVASDVARYPGSARLVAWVDAWTDTRQVKDAVLVPLTVALPG